ncbi:type VI secretion system Vgr family protein [Gemmatimonas groenlandica]|uniref:Type VI secretion system tip protein VgrG n=1 Tax=Gemmatimonas groenlandica TaxID=2732249 RepID=A0A6M4ITU9_9BACT|nr:type VI secretion system tip protein TssI/VgrG [Gemmatimonas groenlandica]QJR36906.1 type VI secretion system tip protein VgrG [Gemmatimonas groenlandica]
MAWSQADRPYRLNTPLGKDVLLLREWRGEESLSTLFRYTVTAMSTRSDISAKELLLKKVSLLLRLPDGTDRTVHGVVSRLRRGGKAPVGLVAYELEIRPPQWVLDLDEGFEIFQNKSARDIVNALMTGVSTAWKLTRTVDERPATFRYRESRWNCAARLMEQEGVWFRFDHTGGDAQLVWSDSVASAKPAWGVTKLAFIEAADDTSRLTGLGVDATPFVSKTHLRTASEFLAMKSVHDTTASNGDFTPPSSMSAYLFDQQIAAHHAPAAAPNKVPYDAKVYSKLRQELAEVTAEVYHGTSTYVGLEPGAKSDVVNLSNASLNASLFITKVVHRGSNGDYFANESAKFEYDNEFEAIPAATPYRPARTTPWPHIGGSHTAVVVGPDGDEIYTDEWGRVQVVFKWDEDHKLDLKHSCWVRVATSSAGQQFGTVFLPRIGHEVIVEFLDGNPDNPIITGSLYNSANKHPWSLPGEKNSSGIRTKSTLKGGADDYNELRFDDSKGAELIYKQAQMDLETLVKNDERRKVEHDRTTEIKNNEEKTVKEGWERTTIEKGEQFITVADNNRTLHVEKEHTVTVNGGETITVIKDRKITVKQNQIHEITEDNNVKVDGKQDTTIKQDDTTTVTDGNSVLKVSMGDISAAAQMGDITIKASLGAITLEAMKKIELKVGGSSIVIDMKGVTITGPMVTLKGNAMAKVEAAIVQVDAKGVAMIKGAVTMIN